MSEDAHAPNGDTYTSTITLARYALNEVQLAGLASEFCGEVASSSYSGDGIGGSSPEVDILFEQPDARKHMVEFEKAIICFRRPADPSYPTI